LLNVRLVVLFALLALAIVSTTASAQDTATIRVADLGHSDASSEPLYAIAAGFFKRNGLDVKLSSLGGGPTIIAAIAGGSLEIGFSNTVSAAQAVERGIPIVVLAPAAEYPSQKPDTLLVKPRGSKLKTGADLNGKTVGVASLQGVLQLSAASWIDQNGGDSKTVHFLELPFTEMAAALKAGRIDAAMLAEPVLSAEQPALEPLGDAYGAIAPQWTLGVFVASKAWVTANPDLVRRFVQATLETARWANTHHAETAQILAPVSKIDLARLGTMARSRFGETLVAARLQAPLDAALKYGQLKAPFDAAQWVADANRRIKTELPEAPDAHDR
jgi:NitT/TauT family transport system substrate-binding protein